MSFINNAEFYKYYDNPVGDNNKYISGIAFSAGQNVWDNNFKFVYHITDNTTSSIKDSAFSSRNGTKKGANEPIKKAGLVRKV
ncbi:MAG: hypothetical protein PHG13_01810 [Candidatus Pacebacteria bacterium]|jgi:hypothetical protein|nr:hypothetical protein [Candidatus Paceibacterota bacterium]MDD5721831.1 hypothetical protein [Candidatus Paceibacterota bacterium]NMA49948.1 hypothetical protein [Tissierellia bacterium]